MCCKISAEKQSHLGVLLSLIKPFLDKMPFIPNFLSQKIRDFFCSIIHEMVAYQSCHKSPLMLFFY
jgi:hypothetical protein